jgi:uncharacterized pyridoxal phosphate-containing UPF0001 family protein
VAAAVEDLLLLVQDNRVALEAALQVVQLHQHRVVLGIIIPVQHNKVIRVVRMDHMMHHIEEQVEAVPVNKARTEKDQVAKVEMDICGQ